MHKEFFCKAEGEMRMFISHVDHPNKFVCTSCGYTTSNPEKPLKKRKLNYPPQNQEGKMDFWELMAMKSRKQIRENAIVSWRSC